MEKQGHQKKIVNDPEPGMPVSELARRTGLTPATINFYVRSGLLPSPTKTGQTRALYGTNHVYRLRQIRELKEAGLPLKIIRMIVEGDPRLSGLRTEPSTKGMGNTVGVASFLGQTGLSEESLRKLFKLGLLSSGQVDDVGQPIFDGQDIAAGVAFATLLENGISMELIERHVEYEPLARAEALFLAEHLAYTRRGGRSVNVDRSLISSFTEVRNYLRLRQLDSAYPEWRSDKPS